MTDDPPARPALSYTNRMGVRYHLHAGRTKTGKRRYFLAKTAGDGALATMPAGFEISESINGVMSVRRVDPTAPSVPAEDLDCVRKELARHRHLRFHRVTAINAEIVVFEPVGGSPLDRMADMDLPGLRVPPVGLADRLAARSRFTPVMKFVAARPPAGWMVQRMTYRGKGGWSWALATGPLAKLVSGYIRHVGTEGFFELM